MVNAPLVCPGIRSCWNETGKAFSLRILSRLGLCIPYGLGVGYALLSSSLLVLLPVCVVGGLLVGPAISCMMDALFRSYRDAPRGWWENYCKGMKQNWKASLLPGVVFSLALGIELFFGMVLFSGGAAARYRNTWLFSLAGLLILFMLFTAFWPQVVLFEESNLHRLQNAILFCLKYGKHVIWARPHPATGLVASVRVVFAVDGLSGAVPRCVVYLVRLLLPAVFRF